MSRMLLGWNSAKLSAQSPPWSRNALPAATSARSAVSARASPAKTSGGKRAIVRLGRGERRRDRDSRAAAALRVRASYRGPRASPSSCSLSGAVHDRNAAPNAMERTSGSACDEKYCSMPSRIFIAGVAVAEREGGPRHARHARRDRRAGGRRRRRCDPGRCRPARDCRWRAPSGRSVTSRSTSVGMPSAGASSWMPPLSVRIRRAAAIAATISR